MYFLDPHSQIIAQIYKMIIIVPNSFFVAVTSKTKNVVIYLSK